jgi:hypothetical protein
MTHDDDAMLHALGGATFRSNVGMPSGRVIGPDEATAFAGYYAEDHNDRQAHADDFRRQRFLGHCRPATAADYRAWLDGYRARGGATTHDYDYDYNISATWYVLETSDVTIPPLYGSQAVHVIVPGGMRLVIERDLYHGESGHNSVFLIDGFRVAARRYWVPTYRDVL